MINSFGERNTVHAFRILFLFPHAVIVDIDVEIKLSNETFVEDLKNKSSPVYKKLESDVYTEVFCYSK